MIRRNSMLVRMIYKNIDRKNMLLYSCSIILSVVLEMVSGAAYVAADSYGLRDKAGSMDWLCTMFFLIAGGISVFFMIYATGYYVRTKNKDYSLLLMLGAGRKLIFGFFAIEFSLIFVSSVILGVLTGAAFSVMLSAVLEGLLQYKIAFLDYITGVIQVFKSVIEVNFILFLLEFPLILLYFGKRNLSDMQLREVKIERKHDRTSFLVIGGAGLIVCAMSLRKESNPLYHFISMVVCLAGVYLLMAYGGSLLLMLVKLFRNFYYGHLITLNEFYYRFKSNCRLLCIMLTLDFVILFFAGGAAVSQMPEDVDSQEYPYGFVGVMKDGGLRDMTREIMGDSSIEIPVVKGCLGDSDWPGEEDMALAKKECFCISDRDYNRLTARDIRLKDTEAVWINESTVLDSEQPKFISLGEDRVLTIAEGLSEIVFGTEKPDCLREFVIVPESVMAACREEPDFIIDEKTSQGEPDLMIDGKEKQEKSYYIIAKKGSAQKEYEQYGCYFQEEEENIFWRCVFLRDAEENMLFVKIISAFAGIFCLLSCFGIFALKMQGDMPLLRKKYEILYYAGMSERAVCKAMDREYRKLLGIPVAVSVLLSGVYMLAEMSGRDMVIRYFIGR